MGNEFPDLLWLISPEFVKLYCAETQTEQDEDSHRYVVGSLIDDLKRRKDITPSGSGFSYTGQCLALNDYAEYRNLLLRTLTSAPHLMSDQSKPALHILIDVPKPLPPFEFMTEIMEITKGVKTFIRPTITFVGQDLHYLTIAV